MEIADNVLLDDWDYVFESIKTVSHIEGFNNTSEYYVKCDFRKDGSDKAVIISGNINSRFHRLFRSGSIKLDQGDYPNENGQVMIEKEFAECNGFSIGDRMDFNYENEVLSLEICGTYEIINEVSIDLIHEGYYAKSELPVFFCDYYSYEGLQKGIRLNVISVYVDKLKNMKSVYDSLSKIDNRAVLVDCIKNHAYSTGTMINALNIASGLMIGFSVMVFGVCVIVLLCFWIQAHKKTIHCLLNIGETKQMIIRLLYLEMGIIFIPVLLAAELAVYHIIYLLGEKIIDSITVMSGNNTLYWDVENIDHMYDLNLEAFTIPALLVILMGVTAISLYSLNLRKGDWRRTSLQICYKRE